MAKDEFSVNELKPNNLNEETTQRDYQGPTAKELVVNSIKIDKTKKNLTGLFVLIAILICIGILVVCDVFNEDKTDDGVNYLDGMPKWVDGFYSYFSDEYEDIIAYNVVFLDFDFDKKVEAVIYYVDNGKTVYDVIDLEDDIYMKGIEVSDIFLMYSFDDNGPVWFVNTSFDDLNTDLINLSNRLLGESEFEVHLNADTLSEFKSNHFTLSYDLKYTKIGFRTVEKNLAEAAKVYEEENNKVSSIIKNIMYKYNDGV